MAHLIAGVDALACKHCISWQAGILLIGFLVYFIVQGAVFGGVESTTGELVSCADLSLSSGYEAAMLYLNNGTMASPLVPTLC